MGIYLICFPWPDFMFNFSKIFVIYRKIVKLGSRCQNKSHELSALNNSKVVIKLIVIKLSVIKLAVTKLAVIKQAVTKLKIPGSCQMITFNLHFRTDSNRTYQLALLSLSLLPIW